jgi:hypothetical protein
LALWKIEDTDQPIVTKRFAMSEPIQNDNIDAI